MNLITLLNTDTVTLASGRLVYSAEETAALESAISAAERLAAAEASATERIAAASEQGRQQGYDAGYAAGLQQAQQQMGAELAHLAQQARLQSEQQRGDATTLAVQIVRKIAARLAPEETLLALAQSAAREFAEDESITLRVHPLHAEAVRQKLQDAGSADNTLAHLTSVVEDASLEQSGCVLETRLGKVIADLDTQLHVIGQNLAAADG